jgi:hypothetical protein
MWRRNEIIAKVEHKKTIAKKGIGNSNGKEKIK